MQAFYVGTAGDGDWDNGGNWSDSSGGTPTGNAPLNGDDVIFDGGSTGLLPTNGPAGPLSLNSFNINSSCPFGAMSSPSLWSNITIIGNCTITNDAYFGGIMGGGASLILYGSSQLGDSATFSGFLSLEFHENSVNNKTSIGAINLSIYDSGVVFTVGVTGSSNFVFLSNWSASVTLNGATATIISGAVVDGITWDLTNELNIQGSAANYAPGTVGFITITGQNTGTVTLIAGTGSTCSGNQAGTIVGNLTLIVNGNNTGNVTGTLTANALDNHDGTWGVANGALGSFGSLRLLGIPRATDIIASGLA
jgi:hypothetical protein